MRLKFLKPVKVYKIETNYSMPKKSVTKDHAKQGLLRLDLELDYMTYRLLLTLVQKSGYDLAKKEKIITSEHIDKLAKKNIGTNITDEDILATHANIRADLKKNKLKKYFPEINNTNLWNN